MSAIFKGALKGIGFGFRRLSIIDLAGGHQPVFNESLRLDRVNGEIYNFPDLWCELKAGGHRCFYTDTEVIVRAEPVCSPNGRCGVASKSTSPESLRKG